MNGSEKPDQGFRAEFQRNVGRYQEMALEEPVVVTLNGPERTVMISIKEYRRPERLDRRVMRLEDFTDADIAAIEAVRAPESTKEFDCEVTWGSLVSFPRQVSGASPAGSCPMPRSKPSE